MAASVPGTLYPTLPFVRPFFYIRLLWAHRMAPKKRNARCSECGFVIALHILSPPKYSRAEIFQLRCSVTGTAIAKVPATRLSKNGGTHGTDGGDRCIGGHQGRRDRTRRHRDQRA